MRCIFYDMCDDNAVLKVNDTLMKTHHGWFDMVK